MLTWVLEQVPQEISPPAGGEYRAAGRGVKKGILFRQNAKDDKHPSLRRKNTPKYFPQGKIQALLNF
jgi:hypothetical protein